MLFTRILLRLVRIIVIAYFLLCLLLYFLQEKLIFYPDRRDAAEPFTFDTPFEEIDIKAGDGTVLNGVLFKAVNPKGLIFYLHGNAGSVASWGNVAGTYTRLGYDVFIPDYRGYGKSEGSVTSEALLSADVQTEYDSLTRRYVEQDIVVLGYSLGTGIAARLASVNHPKLLILQAPYYNLTDVMKDMFPLIPPFLLRYKLETNRYLSQVSAPVFIFHGDRDEVIPLSQSLKLKPLLKPGDELIVLPGQGHNGITENGVYVKKLTEILK